MGTAFEYRSLSFHESWPNFELIRLGRRLGFNDLTFQTEGGTLPRLRELRERADRLGYFRLARELGYTITVWVHEFNELDPSWGEPAPGNARFWRGIEARYDFVLGTLLPEIDSLALTVVETAADVTNPDLLLRLVETMQAACRRHGKRLIFRTFVHHPSQQEEVVAALARMPEDLVVMTKCVPQDWHLRHVDHPLLGAVGGRRQYVEADIAGEYWREDHLANAFTPLLERRFRHWEERGISGLSVRVDRGWKPWIRQATVLGEAQEANLWMLGLRASGRVSGPDEAWDAYTQSVFGERAAAQMKAALMTTGAVVAESLCVGRETFGNGRQRIPAIETMQAVPGPPAATDAEGRPTAAPYDDEEDALGRNPFHRNWSVFRWDPSLAGEYGRIRRGDPAWIHRKEEDAAAADALARESLERLDSIRGDLPAGAHAYFRFRLEENLLHLRAMTAMELAWLKAERRLYSGGDGEKRVLLREIRGHLADLDRLRRDRGAEILRCTWGGRHRELRRFAYLDIAGFVREFRRFFGV